MFAFLLIFVLNSPPDSLQDVAVWVTHLGIWTQSEAEKAVYIKPQYCRRGWIKWAWMPYNCYTDPQYNLWQIPPIINDSGALLAGGVQVSEIWQEAGWPWDNPYDNDHLPPYEIPDPVFYDWATRNTEDSIYRIPFLTNPTALRTWISIANENVWDHILYASYHQIDAGANALDYDCIHGGYKFSPNATPGNNSNTGYDEYHLGVANFANKLSVVVTYDTIHYFMPIPNAGSYPDSAIHAFDNNKETYWKSDTSDSHWIEIDLGRIRTIQQIYLWLLPAHILSNFQIKYWNDTTGWTNFNPPINVVSNSDSIKSFLVEPVPTTKIRLSSSDSVVYLPELQIFGQSFRQFLLKKYCTDSGWSSTDTRWQTRKLVNFSDTLQCPDGTMNTFNYRRYLEAHNWVYNPFGGPIDTTNYLNPPNPLFLEHFPFDYFAKLYSYFLDDSIKVSTIVNLYKKSYTYQTLISFLDYIYKGITSYAQSQGKKIYVTHSHSSISLLNLQGCDHILLYIMDGPTYPAPSATDTLKTHLDGRRAQINALRLFRKFALSGYTQPLPIMAFLDHGFGYFPFSHIGGVGESADERVEYLRTYTWEIYSAGINFSLPTKYPGWNAWDDTTSDGTPVIEIVKQCADFLNKYKEIYRNVRINEAEGEVKVNGIIPFNGEWNHGQGSSVNESKVTISYIDAVDGSRSYLHIINHNWDSTSQAMVAQTDIPVEIPIRDSCREVFVVSPDFPDTLYPDFTCQDSILSLTIPSLEYYDVLILDFVPTSVRESPGLTKPNQFVLYQNYPNPFNSQTTIKYQLPATVTVTLKIYDVLGRDVRTLVNKNRPAGNHSVVWNGKKDLSKDVGSGVYFYQLKVGDKFSQTKKLLLLR